MFDIKLIRDDQNKVEQGLKAKNVSVDLTKLLDLDAQRRKLLAQIDELRAEQNKANTEIARLKKEKKDTTEFIASLKGISNKVSELQGPIKEIEAQIYDVLIGIPNLPHETVPVGAPDKNEIIRSWGGAPKFDFKPKPHWEIAEALDIIDLKRATKLSGANFVLFKGDGALLERALINFMLDIHSMEHGFKEVLPPFLVNTASMTGTGQLPKMKDDMYQLAEDDLYLIPTAEVPVTNIYRDEILAEESLPLYHCAYSACFRREAGSYGKDTRGMIRIHQFDKVELVKFVKPEKSYDELETLVGNAEKILQLLGLPYRVVLLASGDLSFAAAKCYDLEAFSAGVETWLEVSSCSNFEAFQARRANIRFKGKETKKPTHVHTLNGSGVALARTVIAILENYQTKDGDVIIPEALRPYMRNQERITRK